MKKRGQLLKIEKQNIEDAKEGTYLYLKKKKTETSNDYSVKLIRMIFGSQFKAIKKMKSIKNCLKMKEKN